MAASTFGKEPHCRLSRERPRNRSQAEISVMGEVEIAKAAASNHFLRSPRCRPHKTTSSLQIWVLAGSRGSLGFPLDEEAL